MNKALHEEIVSDIQLDRQLQEESPYWLEQIIDEQFKWEAEQQLMEENG